MAKIRTTITMDEELHKDIEDMSDREERSISKQVIYLIRKGIEVTELQKEVG